MDALLAQKNDKMSNMLKELENTRNKQSSVDKESKQQLIDLQKKYDESAKVLS